MNPVYPIAEKELLLQLQVGDQRAFDTLYHHYAKRIFANILKMVKDEDIAQEFLQDVFLKVWEKRDAINIELSFSSYLFQISRNLVYNHFKRTGIDRLVKDYIISITTELHTNEEDQLEYKQSKAALDKLINQLPDQRKLIYTLCKVEGKSYKEVSDQLQISTSTINDHIVKATKYIREHYYLTEGTTAFILALCISNIK